MASCTVGKKYLSPQLNGTGIWHFLLYPWGGKKWFLWKLWFMEVPFSLSTKSPPLSFTGPMSLWGSALGPLGQKSGRAEAHGVFRKEGTWVVWHTGRHQWLGREGRSPAAVERLVRKQLALLPCWDKATRTEPSSGGKGFGPGFPDGLWWQPLPLPWALPHIPKRKGIPEPPPCSGSYLRI